VMDYGGAEIAAAQLEHEVKADDRH
jgi:hypothetical protein